MLLALTERGRMPRRLHQDVILFGSSSAFKLDGKRTKVRDERTPALRHTARRQMKIRIYFMISKAGDKIFHDPAIIALFDLPGMPYSHPPVAVMYGLDQ